MPFSATLLSGFQVHYLKVTRQFDNFNHCKTQQSLFGLFVLGFELGKLHIKQGCQNKGSGGSDGSPSPTNEGAWLKLVLLILTVPASSATSERSFSVLEHMQTCFRSTMSQERLMHLLLLQVHGDLTATLSLDSVIEMFVVKTSERKSMFGTV